MSGKPGITFDQLDRCLLRKYLNFADGQHAMLSRRAEPGRNRKFKIGSETRVHFLQLASCRWIQYLKLVIKAVQPDEFIDLMIGF